MGEIVKRKEPLNLLKRDMETVFDDFFKRDFLAPYPWWERMPGIRQPALDITDEGDKFVAIVELPGLKKEDVKVNVTAHGLEIRAEKKTETEEKHKNYYRKERSHSGFYRSTLLPAEVDPGKVKAKYANGLLEIELPKTKPSKPSKNIKVD